MDSLTQVVLGAAVGEATLGKKVGNKAMLWGAIAGTIPDLDVLVKFFTDDVTANEMHRGFSHSLVFCIILSPILGYLISKIHKKAGVGWKSWAKLSFWSLVTHPLLDAHTTWGTQFFWPFDLRIAYKNINVVDPMYTLPFLLLMTVVLFVKRQSAWRSRITWWAIGLSSLYMVYTIGLKFYMDGVFKDNLQAQEIKYDRITTQPSLMNSILWMSTAETDSAYYLGFYSLMDEGKEISFVKYDKDIVLRNELKDISMYQRLVKLSDRWYLVRRSGDEFIFMDLRFGQMGFGKEEDKIVFRYKLSEQQGEWHAEQQEPPRDPEEMKKVIAKLWQRIKGEKMH